MTEKVDQLNNQAIQLANKGDYKEAIACFKRAITIDQTNHLVWYNLGVTYRDAGKLSDAQAALKQATKLAPDNEDVMETYATVCLLKKDYEMAFNFCQSCLKDNPQWYNMWNIIGVIAFQNNKFDMAADYFEISLSVFPYNLDTLYNLRDTYEKLENEKGKQDCQNRINELEK